MVKVVIKPQHTQNQIFNFSASARGRPDNPRIVKIKIYEFGASNPDNTEHDLILEKELIWWVSKPQVILKDTLGLNCNSP